MNTQILIECRRTFEEIERCMGEVSALLSDVADALSDHPDGLRIEGPTIALPPNAVLLGEAISVPAGEWPSAADIHGLLANWHVIRLRVIDAWSRLKPDEQARLGPPLAVGRNVIRAVV